MEKSQSIVDIPVVPPQFHEEVPHHGPTLLNHLELGHLSQCQAEKFKNKMYGSCVQYFTIEQKRLPLLWQK